MKKAKARGLRETERKQAQDIADQQRNESKNV